LSSATGVPVDVVNTVLLMFVLLTIN